MNKKNYITTDEITYNILVKKIEQLQSNWNSLKEYITSKEKPKVFSAKNGKTLELGIEIAFDLVSNKMNELEGKDNK